MGNACGICKATANPAGATLGTAPSKPLALLTGGLLTPQRRTVVGRTVPGQSRPRAVCGMPYTVDANAVRDANEWHNTALGCATGAREIVAVAPAGCACGLTPNGTKPAGCGCAGKVAPSSGVSPTLPILVPEKESPMTTAPAAGPSVQFPGGFRPATVALSATEQAMILKLRQCADDLASAAVAQREFFANSITRRLDESGMESWRFASAAVAFQLGQVGSSDMADQFFHAVRGRSDAGALVDEFCRLAWDARTNNYAKVQIPTGTRSQSLVRADWSTSSPTLAKAPTKPAGRNSPLGLIAPTVRQHEKAMQRWAGAGIPATPITGAAYPGSVPVPGVGSPANCHVPAQWYTESSTDGLRGPGCYAGNAELARQAQQAAAGGAPGTTQTGPVATAADCTARGGTVYQAMNSATGREQSACLIGGTPQWIGGGGASDTQTASIVDSIARSVGVTAQSVIGLINADRSNDLARQLALISQQTQLQVAAMNQGNVALANRYQEQANAQQSAMITMLMGRLNQQQGQPTFGQMLPMLTLVGLAIGGAYVLTRR